MGKVTRAALIAVDKAPLSLPARSGIDPAAESCGRQPSPVEQIGTCWTPSGAAWRATESKTKSSFASIDRCMRPGETPFARHGGISAAGCATRCLRPARESRSLSTRRRHLTVVPYEGRLPPPLAQCEVVPPCEYRTRTHPLSVISTNAERVHYIDHTVHAPAMMLEHLVDQYWFPAFGLLISPEGRVWRHSFLVPYREGYLSSIKAIVDRPLPDGTHERRLHLERLARAPRIAGEHLLISGSDKHNYGHYLHDIVPLIDLGARMGAPMLTWSLKPWQRALIARLEAPQGLIREIRPRPVFLEHAITSNRFTGLSSQNAHPQNREAFARILANVRKHAPAMSTPPRVLICRSPSNSRNLTNRAAMIEALKALDFVAIQPDKLKFDEQALLFAQAEIIVCEFGAALSNAYFCPPQTKIVEIIAEGQHDPWSSHFCAMLGLEHVVLFQRQSEEVLASMPRHVKELDLLLRGRHPEAGRDREGVDLK